MDVKPSAHAANLIVEASQEWLNACMQPWSILNTLNAFWNDQWKLWLSAVAATPAPWLPALAEDRDGQPAVIDFFLPWLPRLDMSSALHDAVGERDFVRAMLRAAAPHVGAATSAAPAGKANAMNPVVADQEGERAARAESAVRRTATKSPGARTVAGQLAETEHEAKVATAGKSKAVKSAKAPVRKTPSGAKKASARVQQPKDKAAE